MLIGLTGGIASGKSTVSKYLQELGAVIVDADKIAREILKKNTEGYKKVLDCFGEEILDEDKKIHRAKLAKLIFADKQLRKKLENITHPLIIKKIHKRIEEYQKNNRIIILDAPLLFEAGLDKDVDQSWLVYLDKKTQVERLIKRDNIDAEEAKRRIDSQMSLEKKKELADIVIDNKKTKADLKAEVLKLWRDISEN